MIEYSTREPPLYTLIASWEEKKKNKKKNNLCACVILAPSSIATVECLLGGLWFGRRPVDAASPGFRTNLPPRHPLVPPHPFPKIKKKKISQKPRPSPKSRSREQEKMSLLLPSSPPSAPPPPSFGGPRTSKPRFPPSAKRFPRRAKRSTERGPGSCSMVCICLRMALAFLSDPWRQRIAGRAQIISMRRLLYFLWVPWLVAPKKTHPNRAVEYLFPEVSLHSLVTTISSHPQ